MGIVAAESIASFFDEALEDALKVRGVDASASATRYIVGVLADYAHPGQGLEPLGRPLALSLQEALVTSEPAERFSRLRQLGDAVLYASGFFADHFAARGLETRYVSTIGSRAYVSAGAMLHAGSSSIDLFDELARGFEQFARVLGEVADRTLAQQGAGDSRGLLRLYERWLKTGSDTMAEALVEHGIFPTRGSKGVQ
jgi:hypothetical protein